ncbi:integrator complex subunit 6 [Anopheles ziemanni]|uniref:integrator complex subunit 6 n=1 Tax=Anopheles ziemanni TaxID=345580 RepID=UPI00265E3BAC|nr:integrator complex subunit 6 [Anopheles ziemanni]
MTIIVFLVDTSASMCQRAHVNGVQKTYLDIAKGAVETFLKFRQRSQDCMGDRYMLLTFEDPPNNVKAGWKENHATFMNELKNLQSNGLTSMGEALKNAFDLLNLNRMQSGIDTYGQGRCPFYLEPSVIIVLTDGGKYTFRNGVHQEIVLPLHTQMPGTKLTKEPFRWDQRLFSLVLRMPGHRVEERADGKVPHDDSMIEKMCEVTGGRSYKIKSHYVLNQCIESLVQKVQPGVVIHFDQLITSNGESGQAADHLQFQSTKRMIYVPKQHPSQKTFPVGYWPIPEPYWPDPKLTSLPPRDAHPKIKIISPCCDEPQIPRNFPIDKYELEASPLTLQILSKKESNKVWPLIVSTGMQGEMPFGYLKPNSTLPIVHLYVLPYNYQMLLPLINDLFHKFNLNPPNDWVYKFTNYVKTIPQYYCPFLRRALATTPNVPYQLVQYILPENLDSYLCPAVANYLKQMKNTAKQDQENLCMRVLKQLKQPKPAYHQLETAKLVAGPPVQKVRDIVTHPMLKDTFAKVHGDIVNYENYNIVVPTIAQTASTKHYRNPYDIPRRDLIDEIARMREIFFREPPNGISLVTKDSGHCLPIADMGNYQEYLKNKETPLRELEPTNVRQHMFGNPYKKDKNMVMVDEADLNDMAPMKSGAGPSGMGGGAGPSGLGGGSNSGGPGPHQSSHMKKSLLEAGGGGGSSSSSSRATRKRKAGPIRKDYVFKRSAMDASTGSTTSAVTSSASSSYELSSDDESTCSGFTSNNTSDTEDDTEGCLVMALDGGGESDTTSELPPKASITTSINTAIALLSLTASDKTTIGPIEKVTDIDDVPQPADAAGPAGIVLSVPTPSSSIKADKLHSLPPSLASASVGEDVAASEAKPTPPAKQSKTAPAPAADDGSNNGSEQRPEVGDVSSPARKRQLEQDPSQSPPRSDGQAAADGDDGLQHSRKKPRLQPLDSSLAKLANKKQYADSSDAPSKCVEHTSGDTALVEQEPEAELEPQPEPAPPDAVTQDDTEPCAKELEQKEIQQVVEQLQNVVVIDQSKARGPTKLTKQPKEQPEHPPQPAKEQETTRLKAEGEDAKQLAEQTSTAVEPTVVPVEPSAEAKLEPSEPTTKPPPLTPQQLLELAFQRAQRSASQWATSTSSSSTPASSTSVVSSLADASSTSNNSSSSNNSSDMADVQKISNILKTCHNGTDDDRERNNRDDDGSVVERSVHEGVRVGSRAPEPDTSMAMANGTAAPIVTNGGGPIHHPITWNYNVALYSCDEDEQELERIDEHNMRMRAAVFREIRRPGRNYTELMKDLELVQGNWACRKRFIDMAVHEARRFRRVRMAACIEEWWEQQQQQQLQLDSAKPYVPGDGTDSPITATASTGPYHPTGDAFACIRAELARAAATGGVGGAGTGAGGGGMFMSSGITSVYGANFSHNNHHHHHFAEALDEPSSQSS